MKKSLYTFSKQAHLHTTQPFANGQEQEISTKLNTVRNWIVEGLLAAAFSGAIYFLS